MSEYAASESGVLLLNQKLGKWHLQRKLGEGGMSIVYLGYDPLLEQKGAVKVMRPEMLQNKDVLERFRREAKATNKLHHPNIIQVYDFAEAPQVGYYMVLEYLEGQEMAELMPLCPLPINWSLGILKQVCAGLSATHNAGIIHRDLKPSNIFLLPDEPFPRVKILDFGIAKQQKVDHQLTRTGTIMGTPAYLAPEQMLSQKDVVNAQSVDIYAIGVILYQLLTGKLPIERENLLEFLFAIANDEPQKLGEIRPELRKTKLEALVAKMLRKNPADRPQSMEEVWADLERAGKEFKDPLVGTKQVPPIQAPPPFTPPPQSLVLPTPTPAGYISTPAHSTPHSVSTDRRTPLPTGFLEEPLTSASTLAFEDTSTNDLRSQAQQAAFASQTASPSPFSSDPSLPNPHSSNNFSSPSSLEEENALATQRMELPPQKKRSGLWVGLLIFVLLGTGGWFGWSRLQTNPPKPSPVRTLVVQPPPPRRSFLDGLLADAGEAFRQKNYGKAVALWKRAALDPEIGKKEGLGKVYRGIGLALVKQNKMYAAMLYYRRYLNTPAKGEDDAKERERVREEVLPQMERDFKNRMGEVQRLLAQLKRHARSRKLQAMHEVYQKIQAIMPSAPSVYAQIAASLEALLPYHAHALYDRILRDMELTPQELDKIKSVYNDLRSHLKRREDKIGKDIQQISSKLQKSGNSKARRQLDRWMRKDPLVLLQHKSFHRIFEELIRRDPQQAALLLKSWFNAQGKLEKSGMSSWKAEDPQRYIDANKLQERREQLALLGRLASLQSNLRNQLKRSAFAELPARYKEFRKQWKNTNKDPWGDRARIFPRLHSYAEMPDVLLDICNSYKRLLRNREEGVFQTFAQESQRIRGLLSRNTTFLNALFAFNGTSAWRQEITRLDKLCKRGQVLLREGKSLLKKQQWIKAEQQFVAFQKLFPQYIRQDWLNKQIRTCQCARGVTWVSCDDIKIKRR